MNLCLFDLDDTLLPFDSDHAWGEYVIALGWVEPAAARAGNDAYFAQYRAGALDIHGYVRFATAPLRERSQEELAKAQSAFMRDVILPGVRPAARRLVQDHVDAGDRVALVTATNDFVTAPIAVEFGIDTLIAVRLERDAAGHYTGAIAGTPSYREGKVRRVEEWLSQDGLRWSDFERVSVYSDSPNDLPLLERATHPVATNPGPALEAIALQRGWRVLHLFP